MTPVLTSPPPTPSPYASRPPPPFLSLPLASPPLRRRFTRRHAWHLYLMLSRRTKSRHTTRALATSGAAYVPRHTHTHPHCRHRRGPPRSATAACSKGSGPARVLAWLVRCVCRHVLACTSSQWCHNAPARGATSALVLRRGRCCRCVRWLWRVEDGVWLTERVGCGVAAGMGARGGAGTDKGAGVAATGGAGARRRQWCGIAQAYPWHPAGGGRMPHLCLADSQQPT